MDDPDDLFELTFSGQIAEGADPETVRSNAVRLFQLSPEKRDRLFSGATIILKKNLPESVADNYRVKLIAAGLLCSIRSMAFVQQQNSQIEDAPAEKAQLEETQTELPAPKVTAPPSPLEAIVFANNITAHDVADREPEVVEDHFPMEESSSTEIAVFAEPDSKRDNKQHHELDAIPSLIDAIEESAYSFDDIVMANDLPDDAAFSPGSPPLQIAKKEESLPEGNPPVLQEMAALTGEESEDALSPWIDAISEADKERLPTMATKELEDADFPPELTSTTDSLALENHDNLHEDIFHEDAYEDSHEETDSHSEAIDMDADYFDDLLSNETPEEILLTTEELDIEDLDANELDAASFNDEIDLTADSEEQLDIARLPDDDITVVADIFGSEEQLDIERLPDDDITAFADIFGEAESQEEVVFPEEEAMFTEVVLEADEPDLPDLPDLPDEPEGIVDIPAEELDWSLSPVGSIIESISNAPPPPLPDISHLSLQEQSGYLFETNTAEPPPPPDTSNISLAD